jgi:purine-binding chemotaxis protein CheW
MSNEPKRHVMTDVEILEARARRLSRRVAGEDSGEFGVEMLGFTVGRERYAIESRFVFAVVQLADLVPLPGALPPVVGLTRWRGDVLTALDLRRVVGGLPSALDDLGRVIVIGHSAPEFGVLADIIDGLMSIDPSALHPLPSSRQLEIPGLLTGVTSDAVHVLDAAVLIAHQDSDSDHAPSTVPPSTTVSP